MTDMSTAGTARQRILVTGGAGFLGAHLCRKLLIQGHDVVCVDNFLTGSRENLATLSTHPHFRALQHDIIDPLPDCLRPTQIYNLACAASPLQYQQDPVHTLRTCVQGVFNILELASQCNAHVLQASTSEVYGDPQVHPQHEHYRGNVNPVGERACYDEGKRCAEALITDYARTRGITARIARIFNTYGPGMAIDDGRVVSSFICQAIRGEPLTVYGDGSQTRSLCYVDDLIDGLVLLMNSGADISGPVNLGHDHELSMLDLARAICQLSQQPLQIDFQPLPADDPVLRRPDIRFARHTLGWQPRIGLEEGLDKTWAYFSGSTLP